MRRLVIAGGGFAGFWAAAAAARLRRDAPSLASLEILLISRDDQLVIRPRLYEPDPSSMAVPLIPRLEGIGVRFEQGEITSIDVASKEIRLKDAPAIRLDFVRQAGPRDGKPIGSTCWSAGRARIRHRHSGGRRGSRPAFARAGRAAGGTPRKCRAMDGGDRRRRLHRNRTRDRSAGASARNRRRQRARVVVVDPASRIGASPGMTGHNRPFTRRCVRRESKRAQCYDCQRGFGGRGVIERGAHRLPDTGLDHGDARKPSGRARFRRERMVSGGLR